MAQLMLIVSIYHIMIEIMYIIVINHCYSKSSHPRPAPSNFPNCPILLEMDPPTEE